MVTIQFTPELSALQGVIISADYECSFKKLSAKGGYEKEIELVITTVRNFLISKNYLVDNYVVKDAMDTMRQFALYIVLNSDLDVLNELVSTDSTIDLVIWTVPTIPKCLMCEMLWNLYMEEFVKEIITFSYPQLAVEVADALILNIKYMNPTECLKQLHVVTTSCFNLICRIHFFESKENLIKLSFTNFQRCMAYFCNPPNESKLEKLGKDDLYKYYGNCLYTLLSILWECFYQYNANQTCDLENSVALYEVTYNNKCINKTSYKPCECTDKMIIEILNKCLADLLDKCMKLVMGINLDIFCSWSEFEEGGVTMQESVGELCYKVREALLTSALFDHPVVSMLEQISRKPVDIKDIINNTTDSLVVSEKIKENNNESIQWLHSLLHRDNLPEDIVLLQVLDSNLESLDEDKAYEFFQKLHSCVNISTETKQFMQSLVIKLFRICNKTLKSSIVENHFKNENFNNDMECAEFFCMLTEIFNKQAIAPDSDVSDVLNVFLQNPRQVYVTIFKTAIENVQQTDLMFKVITYLSKYSNHYYDEDIEPCLTKVLKDTLEQELNTDVKQDNFTNFVSKLKNADILPASKLLLLIIMPQLHTALIKKDYGNIQVQCKLLDKCYSVEDLLEYRTPMLAMLAQVMAQVRWKINTFNILSPSILNIAINFQTSLMKSYCGKIPENEASWLKRKLKELDPLNMYYYRQLWNPPGITFVDVVSGIHIHVNMDIELLTLWLAQVLCSSTLQEWENIWRNLKEFGEGKILNLFHNAMMSVLRTEKSHRTNTTWSCLLYCYKNLFHCMRFMFFTEPLSDCQVSNVTNKLLATVSCIQDENIEEFGVVVMPLFAYIAERKGDYKTDISQSLDDLPHNNLGVMIHNLFRNST